MSTLNAVSLTADQLAPMLRAWAAGLYTCEAAVQLLIAHGMWLSRKDFREQLVDAVDDGWSRDGTLEPMAGIDWESVECFLAVAPCSSSEASILRIAATLAGQPISHSLAEVTRGLDDVNAGRVLDAIAHRLGWHERDTSRTVDGRLGGAA